MGVRVGNNLPSSEVGDVTPQEPCPLPVVNGGLRGITKKAPAAAPSAPEGSSRCYLQRGTCDCHSGLCLCPLGDPGQAPPQFPPLSGPQSPCLTKGGVGLRGL